MIKSLGEVSVHALRPGERSRSEEYQAMFDSLQAEADVEPPAAGRPGDPVAARFSDGAYYRAYVKGEAISKAARLADNQINCKCARMKLITLGKSWSAWWTWAATRCLTGAP